MGEKHYHQSTYFSVTLNGLLIHLLSVEGISFSFLSRSDR